MKPLIMKFGGASLATPAAFTEIATLIQERREENRALVVVVSAMAGHTDTLIALAKSVHQNPPQRELDMLISIGERMSISLLAMALNKIGLEAVSFTGSQSGIITTNTHSSARIIDVRPVRIMQALQQGKVVIVAGFQGMSHEREITTLGRGGSDTTAVALGVALGSDHVEFYKDVEGIYTKDPKKDDAATLLPLLHFTKAYEITSEGAKILHPRSIALAAKNELPLHILCFKKKRSWQAPGTMIRGEKERSCRIFYEE